MAQQGRILVVGERSELSGLRSALTTLGYDVCAAESSVPVALAAAAEQRPEVALLDSGLSEAIAAGRTLSTQLGISVVYLVDAPAVELLERAQAADPMGYVLKPVDSGPLRLAMHSALAIRRRLAKPKSLTQFPRQQLLENIFQSVNEGVAVVNMQAEVRYVNPAGARLVGMETVEAAETRLTKFQLFQPNQTTLFAATDVPPVRAILYGESCENVEAYLVPPNRKEGTLVSIDAKPLYDEEGRRRGCLVVFRDIGAQKRAEAELRETAARLAKQTHTLETVFDGIADGVAVVDTMANVLHVNKAAMGIVTRELVRDLPKWPAQPGVGVYFADRVTPVPFSEMPHVRALRGERCDHMRIFVVHPSLPDGALLSMSTRAVKIPGEAPTSVVLLFRDVSADHQQEQALLNAFAEGRLEVIDTVLHNVGNALNSVATGVGTLREHLQSRRLLQRLTALAEALQAHEDDWIEYLRDDPQGAQALPFLFAIAKDWQREHADLEHTVDRVASRVEHIVEILRTQQSFDIRATERKTVGLQNAVWTGVRVLEESLGRHGISINVDCMRAPTEVVLQESRFQQMLVNLVGNSIDAIDSIVDAKGPGFRPAVEIIGYVEQEHLVVDVSDNGAGIDSDNLQKVFAPGFTTKRTGSGLGLHSVANYVIGSGGRIKALSEGPGRGATIRSQWPLKAMLPRTS